MERYLTFSAAKEKVLIGFLVLGAVYSAILVIKGSADIQFVRFQGDIFYPWIIAIPQLGLVAFVVCLAGVRDSCSALRFVNLVNVQAMVIIPIVVCFNLVFVVFYTTVILALDVSFLIPPEIPKSVLGNGWLVIVNLIVIGLLVPFAEELFFRGFLMISVAGYFGLYKSLILTSILFACLHGHVGLVIPVLFSSITVSVVFIYFRSLWASIAVHCMQNILVSIVAASA